MKKRKILIAILALLSVIVMCACAKDGADEGKDTSGEETSEQKTTVKDTDTDTTSGEETEDTTEQTTGPVTEPPAPETTVPPETQPIGGGNGGGNGGSFGEGGGELGGDIYGGGGGGSFGGGGGNTNDGRYITTRTGKKLIKTVSDRSVDPYEDNSNTLPYMPMQSTTVFPPEGASFTIPKVKLSELTPGRLMEGCLVGYDNYLFYEDTLADFMGEGVLADSLYERTVKMLRDRNNWVERHGKKFYFVIAPNKNSVYSAYMPEEYSMGSYRRYDQFVQILRDAGITAVDLRGAMSAAVASNPEQNLYYKYDTHWNNHAGYIAYRTTMDLIDDYFPNVVIHDKSEYQINYCETYMKDMAYYLGCYTTFKDYGPVYTLKSGTTATLTYYVPRDGWGQFTYAYQAPDGYSDKLYYFQYTNYANTNAPNIYIMRDSYSIAMVPFLKDSFYKSTYNWTFQFSETDILNSGADIVMVIVAERNLRSYVNNKPVND